MLALAPDLVEEVEMEEGSREVEAVPQEGALVLMDFPLFFLFFLFLLDLLRSAC